MEMSKWRRQLFGIIFLLCFVIYATTCVLQRKHGLNDSNESPRWTNFLYDVILKTNFNMMSECSTCHQYDLYEDLPYEYFYRYRCSQLKIINNVSICLYEGQEISSVRPEEIIVLLRKWLSKNDSLGLIDIGSKLGVYSMVGAALGHNVVAVEPNIANVYRFHKAVKLNHFEDNITLLVNAISNEMGVAEMLFNSNDPGSTRMLRIETQPGHSYIDDALYTKFITMNNLVSFCDFKQAILRIDLDGFEHRAFAEADQLFNYIDIPLIIMEWESMRRHLKQKHPVDVKLIDRMVNFLLERHYKPKTLQLKYLNNLTPQNWPYDIVWEKMY